MNPQLTIGSGHVAALGDLLMLTPICRVFDCRVEIPLKSKNYLPLFWHIAWPQLVANPTILKDVGDGLCVENKFRGLFLQNQNCIPYIFLTTEELDRAKRQLLGFNNPMALSVNCKREWASVRELPKQYWAEIVKYYREQGYDIIQFGIEDNFTSIQGVSAFWRNLKIRELAALYFVIGKVLTINSGDHHLAIASGAKVLCLQPKDSGGFCQKHWCYFPKYWKNQKPRVKYVDFDNYDQAMTDSLWQRD